MRTYAQEVSGRLLPWVESRRGFVVAVGGLAIGHALLRLIRIAVPPERVFDEVYSPAFAWKFLQGQSFFDVHPLFAQLPHVLGLALFGDTPLGWRFSPWVFGTLFILGLGAFGAALTGRRVVGVLASLLATLDIALFVYGRTGLPDMFLLATFVWALACFFLSARVGASPARVGALVLAGVLFGTLAATKWFGVGALVLAWGGVLLGRISAGAFPVPRVRAFFLPVALLLLPVATYLLWAVPLVGIPGRVEAVAGEELFETPCTFGRVPDPRVQPPTTWLGRVRHWHCTVWNYHAHLTATHPYASPWWSWPLLKHPVLFFLDDRTPARRISATGNPVLWWVGFATVWLILFSLPWRWMQRPAGAQGERDGSAPPRQDPRLNPPVVDLWLLLGILGFWLPWAFIQRVTFHYHYFLSFTLTLLLLALWLTRGLDRPRFRPVVGAFLLATFSGFVFLYPSATALLAPWLR